MSAPDSHEQVVTVSLDKYDEMLRLAAVLDATADELRQRSKLGAEVIADPAFAESEELAPATYGEAEEAIRAAELVNIGTLAAFVMVCIGVIVLRKTQPNMPRPFKIPGGILIPVLGVISCGALIAFLPAVTHLRFLIWLLAGAVIYFCYSVRHSKLRS